MEERLRLAPVAAYSSQLEADLVVARLAASGIKAYVKSDGLGGTFPGMPLATGGFQVMVAESDAQRGRATVLEMGGQAVDRSTGALDQPAWRITRWLVAVAALVIVFSGVLRAVI